MHDGGGDRTQTVAALETILTELGAQGYQFRALCRDGVPPPATSQQPVQLPMGPDNLPQPDPAATVPAGSSGAITQPTGDNTLHGTVGVKGFARHSTFRKWQLDLLLEGVGETFLAFGESPVPDPADLYAWDTTLYPNGKHLLRLRVVYEGMNYDEYTIPVTTANK